jgi:prophage tail gpP-like protein
VSLLLGDEELDPLALRWVDYSFRLALDTVPSSGDMTLAPLSDPAVRNVLNKLCSAGTLAVVVDNNVVSTARVAQVRMENPGRGNGVPRAAIALADVLAEPYQSDILPGFSATGLSVRHAAERLFAPWGIEIEADARADRVLLSSRLVEREVPIRSLRGTELYAALIQERAAAGDAVGVRAILENQIRSVTGGQTAARSKAYELALAAAATSTVTRNCQKVDHRDLIPVPGTQISRWFPDYLRAAGLLCWASSRGKAVLSAPDYDQAPSMRVGYTPDLGPAEGTILTSSFRWDIGRQPTAFTVAGRAGARGADKVSATASDDDLISLDRLILRYVSERNARDLDAVRAKAEGMLREAQLASWEYECVVAGHGVGAAMQAPDTMVDVQDPMLGIAWPLYCMGVDFNLGGGVPKVTMRLVRPGLWGVGSYAEVA